MAAPAGAAVAALEDLVCGASRFPHGVGQRLEVVAAAGAGNVRMLGLVTDDLPAQRGREALGVLEAEVVAVRLGLHRERADDGGPV